MKEKTEAAKPRQAINTICPEQDWNFTGLEGWELVAATYHEYAREAGLIRDFLKRLGPMPPLPKGGSKAQLKVAKEAQSQWHGKLSIGLPLEAFPLVLIYGALQTNLTGAWQNQPEDKRRQAADATASHFPLSAGAGINGERENNAPFEPPFRSGPALNEIDPEEQWGVDNTGFEWRCVGIDWGAFSDKRIIAGFAQWVKYNRPTDLKTGQLIGRRSDKGRDPCEWRVMLERLGYLRLRHRYTFSEAKPLLKKLPQTTKTRLAGELNREAKKAVADFHKLLPFIGPALHPLSWPLK
jgi:hypothetical protein